MIKFNFSQKKCEKKIRKSDQNVYGVNFTLLFSNNECKNDFLKYMVIFYKNWPLNYFFERQTAYDMQHTTKFS